MFYINFLTGLLISAQTVVSGASFDLPEYIFETPQVEAAIIEEVIIPEVPFYSQFRDIHLAGWQKVSCGIADLGMIIDYYSDEEINIDNLLREGISSGAFINGAGWSHMGLINLSNKYGLGGKAYYPTDLSSIDAFDMLKSYLEDGPAIASVHYKLEPTNPIPHLIVVNGVKNGLVYYNDPANAGSGDFISIEDFIKAWKQKFIVIRPI